MNLLLQNRLYSVSVLMTASVKIPCANLTHEAPIITAEFEADDNSSAINPCDIETALEEQMINDGWERGNCPHCVESIPNLAKLDHEAELADEDQGGIES